MSVKPWVIQSFTFDSMDRILKCDHLLESCLRSTSLWCCLIFNFPQCVSLDLALSGVK